jgi:hypothetical protein
LGGGGDKDKYVAREFSWVNVAKDAGTSFVRSAVTQAFSNNGKVNWESVAADAFGNALGNNIVGHYRYTESERMLAENSSSVGARSQQVTQADMPAGPVEQLRDRNGRVIMLANNGTTMTDVPLDLGLGQGASNDATGVDPLNDDSSWADPDAVSGPEASSLSPEVAENLKPSKFSWAGVANFFKGAIDWVIGEDFGAAWRSAFTEKWVPGPTGGLMPESLAKGLREVGLSLPDDATANGMHAWHAGSNAYLAQKLGIVGAPLIFLGGLYHESPLDWGSFQAEQHFQGTVNHILDSTTDIVANLFGMLVGYTVPTKSAVDIAVRAGNYIPGPGEPDPAFGGKGPYKGNPVDAWGQYPK